VSNRDLNHHILSVLVQNRPGVLARVSGLFARRGYNIYSLAVAPAEDPNRSRITIVVDLGSAPLEQITKQLFKLIDELMITTVRAGAEQRSELASLIDIFEGKIIAVAEDAITISLEGHPDKLDDCEDLLGSYGILELQRTGRVALPKIDRQGRLRVAN
jgi:acetolactate synthase-1/3 small subunit